MTSNLDLTPAQIKAAGTEAGRVYIEAEPGSGKTVIAAERFGVHRYTSRGDFRAVLALCFNRAAATELRERINTRWGRTALTWPHRVATIDAYLHDLLGYLLRHGLLTWPGGCVELTVADSWKAWGYTYPDTSSWLSIIDGEVVPCDITTYRDHLEQGKCTHAEIRTVLNQALENHALADAISTHIKTSIRALIVDEIFDANELDLRLVSMACEQDIKTTIIGDPWQALYAFRGATPELVHKLVSRYGFISCPLSESFRFRSPETILLAECLRARKPVELSAGEGEKVDVALAWKWQSLWSAGTEILPLSFGPPHTAAESAVALLLNQLTQVEFGLSSTFLNDALRNLGILDPAAPQRLFEWLGGVLASLASDPVQDTWKKLSLSIRHETKQYLPETGPYRELENIKKRVASTHPYRILGITIHQAKGCEWDRVAVRLTSGEHETLRKGLDSENEEHRILYVGLTRARFSTVAI